MTDHKLRNRLLIALMAGLLAACGGGGGSSNDSDDQGTQDSSSDDSSGGSSGDDTSAGGDSASDGSSGNGSSGDDSNGGSNDANSGGGSTGGDASGGATTGGDTSTSSGSAAACLNTTLYTSAGSYSLNYNISGSETGTSATTGTSQPGTSFQGAATTRFSQSTITTLTAPTSGTFVVDVDDFQSLDGNASLEHGSVTSASVQGIATTTTTVLNPPARNPRFTLSAGQSATTTRSGTATTEITGLPVAAPATSTPISETVTITYVGQESVSVPAGSYNACKFTTSDGNTEWYAPGSGVLVKSESVGNGGSVTLELTSAQINGAAI